MELLMTKFFFGDLKKVVHKNVSQGCYLIQRSENFKNHSTKKWPHVTFNQDHTPFYEKKCIL